jgi:hypothetical protein
MRRKGGVPMKPILQIIFAALLLAACDTTVLDQSDRQLARLSLDKDKACAQERCPCDTPLGSIEHGSKIRVYDRSEVQCTEGCAKYSQELTCENGTLMTGKESANTEGKFFKCSVLECPACQLGNNLIRNNEIITAYDKKIVGCRESCEDFKQLRTCEMGILSGSDAFKELQCETKECRCELPDSSSYISLDGKVKLFSREQAVCGSTCANFEQERTCVAVGSGTSETFALNGSASFRFRECREAENCFCTLPNGLGVVEHGGTKRVWTAASVQCGQSCNSVSSVEVKCENGIFKNNANLTQTIDFTSAAYSPFRFECTVDSCVSCPIPGSSISVPHGTSRIFYRAATVACSQSCDARARTCMNGQFNGDTNYNATSCSRRRCTCDVPGQPGVTVPIGSTWKFHSASMAQCSQTCDQISTNKTCAEVESSGTYSYVFQGPSEFSFSSCNPPVNCSCALPGDLGAIEDKKTQTLTSLATVPCGKSCSEIPSVNVTCANGLLIRTDDQSIINPSDATYPYRYFCNQAVCQACPLPGYGSIPNNTSVTLYSKNVLTCADEPASLTFNFACENGRLVRNGNPYDPAADPNRPPAWYTSYTVNCPGCELPWGGFVAEGGSVNAYKFFGTVINNCGRGCKMQQRSCTKGVLDGDPSFNLQACNNTCALEGGGAPPRVCLLRWQNSFVTPDAQIPIWKRKSVPCGESCQSHFSLARCEMSTGNFMAPLDYYYPSCTELCAD